MARQRQRRGASPVRPSEKSNAAGEPPQPLSVTKRIAFGALAGLLAAALVSRYWSAAPPPLVPAGPMLRNFELDMEAWNASYILSYGKTLLDPNTTRFGGSGMVLAYVTPWHTHGFDLAFLFRKKLTHVSPVWMQIKQKRPRTDPRAVHITGHHEVHADWLKAMRGDGTGPKVVPRFMFDGIPPEVMVVILQDERTRREIVAGVAAACERHGFDGAVIEVFNSMTAAHMGAARGPVETFLEELGAALRGAGRQLGLVVPPEPSMFGAGELARLAGHVDYFSLMTYDYAPSAQEAGFNAPLPWVRAAVEALAPEAGPARHQLLTGIPFYGYEYSEAGAGPVVAHEFLSRVQQHRPEFRWDERASEHAGQFKAAGKPHLLFYPSPRFVRERVELARELGTGLSIWELGQGLECFFDYL
eukprot:tig00001376_g8544.t1